MTKTYIFPDGKKAVFEYDHNGVGKITLECMDMLMSLLGTTAEQTEPQKCETCKHYDAEVESIACERCLDGKYSRYEPKTEPKTDPCDGCVCDDGKHLMYCMNCKGIAWKTEPPKVETEPQTNEDQHVQRVEYVGNDEKSRCWTCKHFERMHETPIASDGNYYTYVVCTAKECHYEPQTEPQTERSSE